VIYALQCSDPEEGHVETVNSTMNLLPVELTIHDHCGRESWCALHKLPAILGRDEHGDVQLTDPWVSQKHCEIDQVGDVLVARDLDSKNGIFIHGRRVRESHVLPGERLAIGRTEVTVRYPGMAQTVTEAAVSRPSEHNPPQTPLPDTWEIP
jgi:predicted component of type VI protein secretion system